MRIFLTGIICILFSGLLGAQTQPEADTSLNILLLREKSFGIVLHTQGWGVRYNRGYNPTAFKRRMLSFELIDIKSPREIRTINPYFTSSKSYVYGKLNSVFALRGAYGIHKQLNRKPYWGGVELRYFYMGGLSLAVTKPVYLYILNALPVFDEYTISEEKYDPSDHFVDNIYGRAPFTRGFNKLDFYPGIHGKIGLNFDYASFLNKVTSLEVGAIIDIFPRPVPIMAFNEANYYFLTFYLNFNFGTRYN